MANKALRITCILLSALWMILIFAYSAQHAEQSSQNSAGVVDRIIQGLYPDFSSQSAEDQAALHNTVTVIVRKGAHMAEYALLSMLIYLACASFKSGFLYRRKGWIAFALSVVYAVTDELHQLFVPGRSGELRDVIIDACGAAIGVLIVHLIHVAIVRKRRYSFEG